MTGARVDDQPGRLVHHDDLGVGMDHLDLDGRVGLRPGRGVLLVPVDRELLALSEGGAPAAHRDPVDPDPTLLDQCVHRRPGQVGHQGHRLVDPDPVERCRNGHREDRHGRRGARRREITKQDAADHDAGVGHVEGGPEVQRHEVDHGTVVVAEEAIAEIAQRAAQDEPQHDGPAGRRGPPRHHRQHGHQGHGHGHQHHRLALEQAEGRAGVAGQFEVEGADHVDRSVDEPGDRPPFGELIDHHDRHRHGHRGDQPRPPGGPADPVGVELGHRRPAGQRRDSPPLLQATHRRAKGRARSRAFGMAW